MAWTADELQALARENARIGFQPGDLLPATEHRALQELGGYLAFLATVRDGAGVAGFIEALRRYTAQHPTGDRAT